MSQRLHVVNASSYHWAMEKEPCPTCQTGKGFRCIDMPSRTVSLPNHMVHVSRVRANGFNVRL